MSCCGRKRVEQTIPAEYISRTVPGGSGPVRPGWKPEGRSGILDPRPKVTFEYIGNTAMAVIGGVSRLRYTFIKPGTKVEVDARDRASLAAIPHLRQVG
jgi:hypothetical protein